MDVVSSGPNLDVTQRAFGSNSLFVYTHLGNQADSDITQLFPEAE